MDIEILLDSQEYKTLKIQHEKTFFKLFGKYCKITSRGIEERTATEMSEKFKNKKNSYQFVEETTTKKGTTISTSKNISKNLFEIWSNDPNIPEFDNIVFQFHQVFGVENGHRELWHTLINLRKQKKLLRKTRSR
jgi:hypothetical protein